MEGQRRKILSCCSGGLSGSFDGVDADEAKQLQGEVLVQLNTAPAHNLASEDRLI